MRIINYYLALLVLIVLVSIFLWQGGADSMSMQEMVSVCLFLGIYVVAMSVVGEGRVQDERDLNHRYASNRLALVAGSTVLSAGILFQLFNHSLDYWLLAGLICINLVKIASLIYLNYKN